MDFTFVCGLDFYMCTKLGRLTTGDLSIPRILLNNSTNGCHVTKKMSPLKLKSIVGQ